MSLMGLFYLVLPENWLFASHGDVLDAKRRAAEWLASHGSYDGAEKSIEEFVRQWTLRQLLDAYAYPVEWLGERIIIEESVKMRSAMRKSQVFFVNNSSNR